MEDNSLTFVNDTTEAALWWGWEYLKEYINRMEAYKELSDLEAKGVWPRWQRWNKVLVRWMEINEPLLKEKVCKQVMAKASNPDSHDL